MFALFAGSKYYPRGGWKDFIGVYDTLEDAKAAVKNFYDWYHVVDLATQQVVNEG